MTPQSGALLGGQRAVILSMDILHNPKLFHFTLRQKRALSRLSWRNSVRNWLQPGLPFPTSAPYPLHGNVPMGLCLLPALTTPAGAGGNFLFTANM